jgi:hypothetical protein
MPLNGPNSEPRIAAGRLRRLRVCGDVFLRLHVAQAEVRAPFRAFEVRLHVRCAVLLVDLEQVLVVGTLHRVSLRVAVAVVGRELVRRPEPDVLRDIAAEAVEVRRIVLERVRVVRGVDAAAAGRPAAECRTLGDAVVRLAAVLVVARTELEVRPGAVVDRKVPHRSGPSLPCPSRRSAARRRSSRSRPACRSGTASSCRSRRGRSRARCSCRAGSSLRPCPRPAASRTRPASASCRAHRRSQLSR